MTEEYNPFQSPESPPSTPEYLVPDGIVRRRGTPFASAVGLAICAMIALGAIALLDVASIGLDCWRYTTIRRIQRGEQVDFADIAAFNRQIIRFGQIELGCWIVTIVLYLFWIHRAYRNLPALGNPVPSATPAWAVGSYFVPVVNLFIPYTIMTEIWRYSDPAQLGMIRKSTSPLVGVWWGMLLGPIVPMLGMLATLLIVPSRAQIDEIAIEAIWTIAMPAINLIAAILAIKLVYSIDKNQRTSNELIETQYEAAVSSGERSFPSQRF